MRYAIPTLLCAAVSLAACGGAEDASARDTAPDDVSAPEVAGAADAESASYRVVAGWPSLPEGFEMGEAAGVDVDSQGRVWVFHRGDEHPIMAIDAETGEMVTSFGGGMFVNAHGLEVDHEDNVWVTDTQTHQVYKFSQDGELLMTLGEEGVAGLDESHFDQPTDVVIAPTGEFFVSDGYGNSRVVKFDAEGNYIMEWGEPGEGPSQFDLPHGIALDDEGRVYVADRTNLRVQVFTSEGEYIDEWHPEEWARPWGLQVTDGGEIFVMDGGHMSPEPPHYANVLRMTLDGEVLEYWGSYGPEPGQFSWGHDVAVGPDGAVYTVEVRNNLRAQKFVRGEM